MIGKKLADLVVRSAEQAGDAARSAADSAGDIARLAADSARATATSAGRAVADRVVATAGSVGDAAARTAHAVQEVLPDRHAVRRSLGDALVFGGKLLYDPRATVGELAIGLGQGIRPHAVDDCWLLLRATDSGFEVIGRGDEAQMRQAFEQARRTATVLLCQARAASEPPGAGA